MLAGSLRLRHHDPRAFEGPLTQHPGGVLSSNVSLNDASNARLRSHDVDEQRSGGRLRSAKEEEEEE